MKGKIISIITVSGGYYPKIEAQNGAILNGTYENISEVKTVREELAAVGDVVTFSTDGVEPADGVLCAWALSKTL